MSASEWMGCAWALFKTLAICLPFVGLLYIHDQRKKGGEV
jgi:hypothetical protein